jgi:hypothetical protein
MAFNPPALDSQIRQHHHNTDEADPPASLRLNQTRHDATLDVQGVEGLLQVAQIAFDFETSSARTSECQASTSTKPRSP